MIDPPRTDASPEPTLKLAERIRRWREDDKAGYDQAIELLCEAEELLSAAAVSPREAPPKRPKVICLCGSTRFIELFATLTWVLERTEGAIVLGCTLLPMWFCSVASHFGEATGTKDQCDEHHKRKIDLADEVLVINAHGYIGESTRSEIEYATRLGKPIRYLESEPELMLAALERKQEPEAPREAPPPRQAELKALQEASAAFDRWAAAASGLRSGTVRPLYVHPVEAMTLIEAVRDFLASEAPREAPPPRQAEWMPIASAPKDGTPVLTRALNGARRWCDPSVLYYIGGIWRTSRERDPLLIVYHQPVVWMPLPDPPSVAPAPAPPEEK